MQSRKSTMESLKETATNIAASAKAGMDKTKATVQEKVEKMTARTPAEKELAEERKREKIRAAEIGKQETIKDNATAAVDYTRAAHAGGHIPRPGARPVWGAPGEVAGHPTGGSAVEGVVESRPIGRGTGTGRPSASHNPHAESTEPAARGTGGHYT